MSSALTDTDEPFGPAYRFRLARRRSMPLAFSRQRVVEGLWALFIMAALGATRLFGINNAEKFAWLAADFVVLAFLLRDYRPIYGLAGRQKIFMSWAGLALLSTLWSLSPGTSLYQGVQLLMTILVSFLFCLQVPRGRMPVVVFTALVACLVSSIGFVLLKPGLGTDQQGAWIGVFQHKNQLGAVAAVCILTSTCLFLSGWRPLVAALCIGVGAFVLAMSHSGTALIAVTLVMCLVVLAFGLRQGRGVLSFGMGLLALAASFVVFFIAVNQINVFDLVLEGMGKDSTLSGRTILWDIGLHAFSERPVLGHGYNGFWVGDPSTVSYLQWMVQQPLWFFHNNFIEMAVAFGIMGPVLLLCGIVYAIAITTRNFLRDRRYSSLWCLLLVAYVSLDTMAEYPLFLNHSVWQFLFVATVASMPLLPATRRRRSFAALDQEGPAQ